jgi:hypothetical protein
MLVFAQPTLDAPMQGAFARWYGTLAMDTTLGKSHLEELGPSGKPPRKVWD